MIKKVISAAMVFYLCVIAQVVTYFLIHDHSINPWLKWPVVVVTQASIVLTTFLAFLIVGIDLNRIMTGMLNKLFKRK